MIEKIKTDELDIAFTLSLGLQNIGGSNTKRYGHILIALSCIVTIRSQSDQV